MAREAIEVDGAVNAVAVSIPESKTANATAIILVLIIVPIEERLREVFSDTMMKLKLFGSSSVSCLGDTLLEDRDRRFSSPRRFLMIFGR
jgi:hypothetical protein